MRFLYKVLHMLFSSGCCHNVNIRGDNIVCKHCEKKIGFIYTDPGTGELKTFTYYRNPKYRYYISEDQLQNASV